MEVADDFRLLTLATPLSTNSPTYGGKVERVQQRGERLTHHRQWNVPGAESGSQCHPLPDMVRNTQRHKTELVARVEFITGSLECLVPSLQE